MPRFHTKEECIEYYTGKGFNEKWIERICEVVTFASRKRIGADELRAIRGQVVAELQATGSYSTTYTLGNGVIVDVVVVAVPTKPIIKETASGNYKIGALDPETNEWISLFFDSREDAESVADRYAGDSIIVVGKKREREMPDGRVLVSINVWGYTGLAEEDGEGGADSAGTGEAGAVDAGGDVDVSIPEDLPSPDNV